MAKQSAIAPARGRDISTWGSEAIVCVWVWLVMAGCFVALAVHAASGHIARTDLRLLSASHRLPDSFESWANLQRDLGSPEFLTLSTVLLATVLLLRWAWSEAIVVLAAFGVFALTVLIKHIVQEVPPFQPDHAEYLGILESNYSFPSGHVVGLTVFFGLFFLFADRLYGGSVAFMLRLVALFCIVTAGPGRVYLSVHYPSDVIAGYLLAALYLLPVWFCFSFKRRTMPRSLDN